MRPKNRSVIGAALFSSGNRPYMPTYEYQCEKCKKSFETYQSMKDEPLKTCPKDLCRQKTWGKGKVKRQLGAGFNDRPQKLFGPLGIDCEIVVNQEDKDLAAVPLGPSFQTEHFFDDALVRSKPD